MHEREIYTTDFDMDRLRQLLEGVKLWSVRDREHLTRLARTHPSSVVIASSF